MSTNPNWERKIIHIDMDCFYAAIEIRDNPSLANKPVAVGGSPSQRGVLCTANYIARRFGIKSAMATAHALKLCPDLIILPVNINKYREISKLIHKIFYDYTTFVEPLSLDEAYLDVTNSYHCKGSATLMANEIRQKIWDLHKLTASAGVAPNKFLAKIASSWNKPNGILVVTPNEIKNFIPTLPIEKIFGVGKVTANKLHRLAINTCFDLQQLSLKELIRQFGKFGYLLYHQCRGIDHRPVEPNRLRKSISVEHTFEKDFFMSQNSIEIIEKLHEQLLQRINNSATTRQIKNQFIKIKFSDFKQVTLEKISRKPCLNQYIELIKKACDKRHIRIRLIGIGVHFDCDNLSSMVQQDFFINT